MQIQVCLRIMANFCMYSNIEFSARITQSILSHVILATVRKWFKNDAPFRDSKAEFRSSRPSLEIISEIQKSVRNLRWNTQIRAKSRNPKRIRTKSRNPNRNPDETQKSAWNPEIQAKSRNPKWNPEIQVTSGGFRNLVRCFSPCRTPRFWQTFFNW